MKSLSLKVMTLLMAALVLSASGCFNDEMSSPEGTVKGWYKAMDQINFEKMFDYIDPREGPKDARQGFSLRAMATEKILAMALRKSYELQGVKKNRLTDVKITLVSKKESLVWKGDKWHRVKNENATVEVSYKVNGKNLQQTEKLVLLDNKWYITNEWE